MKKRNRKHERDPILVEVRSELEQGLAARIDRWQRAGQKLLALDVERFERTLRLAESYIGSLTRGHIDSDAAWSGESSDWFRFKPGQPS